MERRTSSSSSSNYGAAVKKKPSLDVQHQMVQTLFIRNRAFMSRHNITTRNPTFKEHVRPQTAENALEMLQNASNSELFTSKLSELMSTQDSFQKHFVNSDLLVNNQIQFDCNRQRQRVLFGSLGSTSATARSSARYAKQESNLRRRNSIGLNGSTINVDDDMQSQTCEDSVGSRTSRVNQSTPSDGMHAAIYAKTPSAHFSLSTERKDLFAQNGQAKDCVEARFNNFKLNKDPLSRTSSIEKSTPRKYEVFSCQISELKYNNTCEIYQKNAFPNLHAKCLFDYSRQRSDLDREYFFQTKDQPITAIDSDKVMKGKLKTSRFQQHPSPDIKKQLGREKRMNFFSNVFALKPEQANSNTAQGSFTERRAQQHSNHQQQQSANYTPQTDENNSQSGDPLNLSAQNFYDPQPTEAQIQNKKQNQRSTSLKDATPNTNNDRSIAEHKTKSALQRNPLSLFRERRRKIHKLLNID